MRGNILKLVCVVATLLAALSWTDAAEAGNDEGYAVAGYLLITGGGITSAIGSQVTLIQGRPDERWGIASLSFAGANAVVSTIFLLISAFASDETDQLAFGIAGGAQMSIAVAALVSGASVMANQDGHVEPVADQLSLDVRF